MINQYSIGKHALEHRNTTAVRNFINMFPYLSEINMKEQLAHSKRRSRSKERKIQQISKDSSPTGKPLLVGKLCSMVQSYLKALSKPDAVITTTSANATVNALIKSNPGFAGDIDIICFVVELVYLGIIYLVYLVYS